MAMAMPNTLLDYEVVESNAGTRCWDDNKQSQPVAEITDEMEIVEAIETLVGAIKASVKGPIWMLPSAKTAAQVYVLSE